MAVDRQSFSALLREAAERLSLSNCLDVRGVVRYVGDGVALVSGLEHVRYEELLTFDSGAFGMAFDLRPDLVGVILLVGTNRVREGDGVAGTGRLPELLACEETLGRVLDPLGNPLDERAPITRGDWLPLFRPAPEIVERRNVDRTLWTGVTAIDSAIPIGRGQRELIIGDRNVGKTALAIDVLAAQQPGDVACVYVVIGQPMSRVVALRETLAQAGCLANTAIIAAEAAASPGMQFLAPYAGAAVAEWFRDRGRDALVVFDDLTKHADAYREVALLLGRPPGREAFPGDIFYVHAELLERAAALSSERGGGSVTALPLAETVDGDISTYLPTNLISMTDGQIYLDSVRFERDQRPAVDVSRSVSRIGAVAQPKPLRRAARNLRIVLSQFEALEKLSRAGLDVDVAAKSTLQQGDLLRGLMRQRRTSPRGMIEQVLGLTAVSEGWIDGVDPALAGNLIARLVRRLARERPQVLQQIAEEDGSAGDWRLEVAGILSKMRSELPEGSV